MGRTGTIHDFKALGPDDRPAVQHRLNRFTAAEDPAQVTLALCGLLDFLADIL